MKTREVIILGAGLAGLSLAYQLKKLGFDALILEARDRVGGRIQTINHEGTTLELGATWFADKHTHLLSLLNELGLEKIEQDYGKYAVYEHPDGQSQLYELPPQTEASYRIKGGTSQLIESLKSELGSGQILLQHEVNTLRYSNDRIDITTNKGTFSAQKVINTLPPNLFHKLIKCTPNLPSEIRSLHETTHTWMGESIKVGFFSPSPFWNEREIGTIYSQRGPITEMYDHSNQSRYALKGFIHEQYIQLPREEREKAARMQLSSFFGKDLIDECSYVEETWRNQQFTYAAYDNDVFPHQNNGHEQLRQPLFDGKLYMAGSETAIAFPGYLDGAVESSQIVCDQIQSDIKKISNNI